MLRIALCDDAPAQRLHMAQMLRKYLCRRPEAAGEVSAFASGQELLDSIEAGGKDYDLYIMDALMPGLTGTDLGVRLRELGGSGAIIYLVSAREHTLEAYKSHALGYLLKPVDQDTLSRKLDYAIGTLQQKLSACVPVKTRGGMCCLSLAGLLYVEMRNRVLRYHRTDSSVAESLTLRTSFQKAAEPLLEDGRFFRCGTSLAVNLHHVSGLDADGLKLENGDTVPLPRGMLGEARRRWSSYWRGDPLADKALCVKCGGQT